ncbi:MAG: hypothetical protein WC529_00060 [Candidatus Margulisiibacteriota bacterium]
MLKKTEFDKYRARLESQDIQEVLSSGNPDAISKLGGEVAAYYARVNNELADVKDVVMALTFEYLQTKLDRKGKPITKGEAEIEAELVINGKNEVTRRQMKYLCDGLDKISYACSTRISSFKKEGFY